MRRLALILLAATVSCTGSEESEPGDDAEELSVGELSGDDGKADGNWGSALTCKSVPALPPLAKPEIIVSLDGLTLRLIDRTSGFEKVYPIGAGARDTDPTSLTYGESLSYYPIAAYGKQDFTIKPTTIQPCKIWWTDPATGERLPVFAGMPFLSWSGSYGIHGPIDNYRAPSGGSLRRGYVSHGCIRMAGADILELYAHIKGVASIPVHVQREAERTTAGTRVDVAARWIGAECSADRDCAYGNGFCKPNPHSGRGFCSARCTTSCADRPGQPTTFCVRDPDAAAGQGMCLPKHSAVNSGCRPYDHLVPKTLGRPSQPGTTAAVCAPGSPGWVGDRCLADADCASGTRCRAGTCTQACDRYCTDQPGYADTFCVSDPVLGAGGSCVRQCSPASNGAECAAGSTCVARARNGLTSPVRNVCIPTAP